MITLGETNLKLGNAARAKQLFERVAHEYGNTLHIRRAELFLDFIKHRYGDNPPDQAMQPMQPTNG
jgi:outer membrane protein assembly factor BamD (BamD/ComL family)